MIGIFRSHRVEYTLSFGGSFPLRVYLPESDLDVVVATPGERDDLKDMLEIFSCLCQAIKEKENSNSKESNEVTLSSITYFK